MLCRRSRISIVGLALLLIATVLTIACSSDDSASSHLSPFDSGSVVVPEAGALAPPSVTIEVQGEGSVYSADAKSVDGSFVGEVTCTSGSAPSQCTAPDRTTLYAVPSVGWVFSAWTTTGLAPGVSLAGASPSYPVTATSPSPVIAVFVLQGNARAPEAGAPPTDAGDGG